MLCPPDLHPSAASAATSWLVAGLQLCHTAQSNYIYACTSSTSPSLPSLRVIHQGEDVSLLVPKTSSTEKSTSPPSMHLQNSSSLLLLPQVLLTPQLMSPASKESISLCRLWPEPDVPNSVLLTSVIKLQRTQSYLR